MNSSVLKIICVFCCSTFLFGCDLGSLGRSTDIRQNPGFCQDGCRRQSMTVSKIRIIYNPAHGSPIVACICTPNHSGE